MPTTNPTPKPKRAVKPAPSGTAKTMGKGSARTQRAIQVAKDAKPVAKLAKVVAADEAIADRMEQATKRSPTTMARTSLTIVGVKSDAVKAEERQAEAALRAEAAAVRAAQPAEEPKPEAAPKAEKPKAEAKAKESGDKTFAAEGSTSHACRTCGTDKPISSFPTTAREGVRGSQCRSCRDAARPKK